MKFGKLPARKNSVSFRLRDYLSLPTLPTPPAKADHYKLVSDWQGTLGNNLYGDCVFAGADHEHIVWEKIGGKAVSFTPTTALSDYSAVTGFNPNDPTTDQGTDMQVAASYRRKTGIVDVAKNRHKVDAYMAITPGNKLELKQAIYLFSNVGIGIQFPKSAMEQFNSGKPWTVVANSPIIGGHYWPCVGYDTRYVYGVTWGKVQKASWSFIARYMDEGIVYLSHEMLTNGKSLEGFDAGQLQADLGQLK